MTQRIRVFSDRNDLLQVRDCLDVYGFARRILREDILFAAMLAVSWALFAYVLPFFGVNT